MKPLALEFQAFGSYPGKVEIDFGPLAARGVFLVTGDTGTGKSTILDAMCFALYGEMPGKSPKEIRSDHAAETVRPYVRFTFEVDGTVYVAERSLEHQLPKQSGSRKAKAEATATLLRSESGVVDSIATKALDVKQACVDLLGLSPEHFQRVVLLPQGEVTRFLHADSTKREELLQSLFGGEVFKAVVDDLGRRKKAVEDALVINAARVDEVLKEGRRALGEMLLVVTGEQPADIDGLDGPALSEAADVHEGDLEGLKVLVEELGRRHDDRNRELGSVDSLRQRFDSAETLKREVADLEPKFEEARSDAELAANSQRARPAYDAFRNLDRKIEDAGVASGRLATALAELVGDLQPFGVDIDASSALTVRSSVEVLDTKVSEQKGRSERFERLVAAVAAAEAGAAEVLAERASVRSDLEMKSSRLKEVESRIVELQPLLADAELLRLEAASADGKVEARRLTEDLSGELVDAADLRRSRSELHGQLLAEFLDGTASRLAQQLVPGEPCPVCGGRDHPAPSALVSSQSVTWEDVQAAEAKVQAANEAVRALEGRLTELRMQLGDDVDASLEALQDVVDRIAARQRSAELAGEEHEGLQQEALKLRSDGDQLKGALGQFEVRLVEANGRITAAQKEVDESRDSVADIDAAWLREAAAAVDRAQEKVTNLDKLFNRVASTAGALDEARLSADLALAESGFPGRESADGAVIDANDERRALETFDSLGKTLDTKRAQLELLQGEGLPDEAPDVDAARKSAESAREALDVARQRHDALKESIAVIRRCVDSVGELLDSGDTDRAELKVLAYAHNVCSKGGVLNMPLQRWVLSRQFDFVTAAANVHLQRMSRGRYTLRRAEVVKDGRKAHGLGLEVTDAETGVSRSTNSLSGGEQFQAALALALGLAEVVSRGGTGSGRRFEALFIDEGFGALDQNALQEAIATLHELHSGGRMVGVITHVEAMKQELHPGIVVTRLGPGKGSTLTVNP